MSKPKHTPGPWRWLSADTLIADHGHRPVVIAASMNDGGGPVIVQRNREEGRLVRLDRESPDAALIAAAPELLEVAHEAFQILLLHSERPKEVGDGYEIARERLRTAIARAEGRS